LALGLKKETADMHYSIDHRGNVRQLWLLAYGDLHEDVQVHSLPAWSLGRLWELYWSNKVVNDCLFGCGKYMNPYARMIAMIEYDIEDGTFNKDYLDK
jgi:hypothetical protein